MRIVVLVLIFAPALIMQPAGAQEKQPAPKITTFTADAGMPVASMSLADVDGDGLGDVFFVTKTRPAWCLVARRLGPGQGFAAPVGVEAPADCDGIVLARAGAGAAVLVLAGEKRTVVPFAAMKPPPGAAPPAGTPPVFFGFAGDLDGDGAGDPMLPVADGFDILMSKTGRTVPIRPPVTRERTAGLRGLLSERARFPFVSLETLAPGAPPRPCFFAGGALRALQGSLDAGFGPGVDTILQVPSAVQEATLERTEARLADIDGSGKPALLILRTKTQGAALAKVTTELIFYRLGTGPGAPPLPGRGGVADTSRPAQVILLSGVLSSGPDLRDVDHDGRPDLVLSVFGQDLSQQIARRITGRVRLDWLVYKGGASGQPFSRAPDFTESDSVPEKQFSDWSLRHRVLLDDDWTGDGVVDLVQIEVGGGWTRLSIRPGSTAGGKLAYASDPIATAGAPVEVKDHRSWRLSPSEPAILCQTATGALVFTLAPR